MSDWSYRVHADNMREVLDLIERLEPEHRLEAWHLAYRCLAVKMGNHDTVSPAVTAVRVIRKHLDQREPPYWLQQ